VSAAARHAAAILLIAGAARAEAPDAGPAEDALELAALPAAEPVSFKAGLEKATVRLADPFDLFIEVRHPRSDTYELPEKLDMKEFSVRSRSSETAPGDPALTRLRLKLQAFDLGEREVPPIVLRVLTPTGLRKLEIPAQKLKVEGVIDLSQGEPKMREDARPLPTRYRPIWWPFAIAGAVLLAALAAWWIRWRMRMPKAAPPPVPRLPAGDEALERLEALEREGLVDAGRRQEYHFRLSEILRDYCGRVYGFDALECTTDELLRELRRRSTPGLDFDALALHEHASDLVKFARRDPSVGECKIALDFARALVVRTAPLRTESSGSAAGGHP